MGEKDHLKIKIGNRLIGSGEPAYLIAEMSANHAGSIECAKEIIHAAKESGADCIKIQTYTPDTLTIDCHNKYFQVNNGTWEGENLYSLYGKAYTPWEWQPQLKAEADKVGIDFLSTPFDNTAVDFLEDMGLEFYKIASFEMIDLPLVEYVASKGKPIIMSTGMATLEEIREAVETVYHTGNRQLVLLKCSSAYPADPAQMYLRTITDMQKRFDLPIGLSDHSMGSMSAVTAVALGASRGKTGREQQSVPQIYFCSEGYTRRSRAYGRKYPHYPSRLRHQTQILERCPGDADGSCHGERNAYYL